MSDWFYRSGNRICGPVTREELEFLAASGRVRAATEVRSGLQGKWRRYGSKTRQSAATSTHVTPTVNDSNSGAPNATDSSIADPATDSHLISADAVVEEIEDDPSKTYVVAGIILGIVALLAMLLLALLLPWNTIPDGGPWLAGTRNETSASAEANATETSDRPADTDSNAGQDQSAADSGSQNAQDDAELSEDNATPEDAEASGVNGQPQQDSSAASDGDSDSVPVADTAPVPADQDELNTDVDTQLEVVGRDDPRSKFIISAPGEDRDLAKLDPFAGRSSFGKQVAIQKFGGTAESEYAVNAGLKWLKKIQRSDGSWSFGDPGEQAQAGQLQSTDMGSTSLALLCFLGAGHTHLSDGPYRTVVSDGLRYLMQNARSRDTLADLRGNYQSNSGMYVQGLATICLCEIRVLEPDDASVRKLARKAIRFIENTQDKNGGGWRYEPGQPGDTSVAGWQVMALHSAKLGNIKWSRQIGPGVKRFLDAVQTYNGERYSYQPGLGATPTMTAVGLLCRMYMGWQREHPSLHGGVAYLSTMGPDSRNMYYNYYATLVIHHWGGEEWVKWNAVMRDQLVSRQIKDGPAAGSWSPGGPHSGPGGQIYETTLSLLTLEVYYRYLPMYRQLED